MKNSFSFDNVKNLLVHSVKNATLVGNSLIVTVFYQGVILVGDLLLFYLSFEGTDARVVPFLFSQRGCILVVRVHGLLIHS